MAARSHSRAPWFFLLPGALVATVIFLPVAYLLWRLITGDWSIVGALFFRWRTFELLLNTLALTAGVILLSTLFAVPLAWLTARVQFPGERALTLAGTLPLAIPGYLMAFALLTVSGDNGLLNLWFGLSLPRLSGYVGAVLAVTLYSFPFLFLNLRTTLKGMDPALEEAARSLGYEQREIFFRVILPQLRPAFLSGYLIISLYVLGDFGAVSLMRYETLSFALFSQLSASADRTYLAALALFLMALAFVIVLVESKFLRRQALYRTSPGVGRRLIRYRIGFWAIPLFLWSCLVLAAALALPMATILLWASQGSGDSGVWLRALWDSLRAAGPAALLAGALALPIAFSAARFPSRTTRWFERVAYFGYVLPPIAFALAFTVLTLTGAPFLYQTLTLLILVYSICFLAEAMGPLRNASLQIPPRLDEAARSLGLSPWRAFWRVVFPLLQRGLGLGIALVFLSALKELPIAFILSPIGFDSLAINIWSFTAEGLYAEAAPHALTLVALSSVLVFILFLPQFRR